MLHRQCRKCGAEKPLADFPRHRGCIDGRERACKRCKHTAEQQWKRVHSAELAAKRRSVYGDVERQRELRRIERSPLLVQAQRLVAGARDRCKELGLPRPEWLRPAVLVSWLTAQPNCECCGCAFRIGPKDGRWHPDSPSLDRFHPAAGYVRENVSLICWRCNNIKRNYTADDLRQVAAWMDAWGNETAKFAEAAE